MPSHTIKVTGVSDELLTLLDRRIERQHASGRAEYIRELIRRDILGPPERDPSLDPTFQEMLAPLHEEARLLGTTEEEVSAFFEEIRDEVYRETHPKTSR